MSKEKLAILGGEPVFNEKDVPESLFKWPIITEEDEQAVLHVLRHENISGHNITDEFQRQFAAWQGTKYALGFSSGTMALAAAMFAVGLGAGDEIICPTMTYWASIAQCMTFGAKPVFCNVGEDLSIDPDDFEKRITKRTKAVMVVHYCAYPADMDRIMEIANKHNIIVIEDVSHAQGGMYKGKKLGTFGKVAAMSLMSGKSFAIGEAGMLVTDDVNVWERAIAYGHYDRNNENFLGANEELKKYYRLPLGGVKGRVNQTCSAMGLVQLKYYDQRCEEIRKALNYFWDSLEGLPGIRALRVDENDGSTMGGWYAPKGIYVPEELDGLSIATFAKAVTAEGPDCHEGANVCLHTHDLFKTYDFRNCGKPSSIEYTDDTEYDNTDYLAPSMKRYCFSIPWFKHFDKEWIDKYIAAFRKVIENYKDLLEIDDKPEYTTGRWSGY